MRKPKTAKPDHRQDIAPRAVKRRVRYVFALAAFAVLIVNGPPALAVIDGCSAADWANHKRTCGGKTALPRLPPEMRGTGKDWLPPSRSFDTPEGQR